MPIAAGQANTESVVVEATVIRKDGTREELGALAEWHRNPIRHALAQAQIKIRELRRRKR